MNRRYRRLFGLRFTKANPADVDDEFRFHLEMRVRELEESGLTSDAARERAYAEFGNVEEARRVCNAEDELRMRRYRRGMWIDTLVQDLRYGLRSLKAARTATCIAIACIAIGVGANLAVFTVVRGVLLRPLPFGAPESVVCVGESESGEGPYYFSPANLFDVATLQSTFSGLTAWQSVGGDLQGTDAPRRIDGIRASGNLFAVLQARAAVGRVFDGTDTLPSSPAVVVLSDALWKTEFGGQRGVVGRTIFIGGWAYVVIGVMPAAFDFPVGAERNAYWTVFPWAAAGSLTNRGNHTIEVIGRLRDGVDVPRARLALNELGRRLAAAYPHEQGRRGFMIESLADATTESVRRPLLLMMGAVALVFLIACANIASVLLARGTGRAREVAVRRALGATRGRLIRQLMTECLLLAAGGALLGVVTAKVALGLLLALAERTLPRMDAIAFDVPTIAIGVGLSCVCILIVSLVPALRATRTDLRSAMVAGASREGRRMSTLDTLIGLEAGLAVMLLIGAGLLVRSFTTLIAVDPGFETPNRLTFRLSPPGRAALADSQRYEGFVRPILEQAGHQAGIRSVGAIDLLPVQDGTNDMVLSIEGAPVEQDVSRRPDAQMRVVAGDYFGAMGIPVRSGRAFRSGDVAGSTPVVVVNEALAKRFFNGRNPVGHRIDLGSGAMWTIVGVVGSTRQIIDMPAMPEVYRTAAQVPREVSAITFVAATDVDPYSVLPAMRAVVRSVAPTQAIFNVGTLDDVIPQSLRARRLVATLIGVFATLAMVLSAAGVYGVTSYAVSRRTREIGIRLALGADAQGVAQMILGEVLRVVAAGAIAGLIAALAASGVIASLLYGVAPRDPVSFVVASAIVVVAGVIAALVPAMRASRVSATVAVKAE